jgi:hypothetical protein
MECESAELESKLISCINNGNNASLKELYKLRKDLLEIINVDIQEKKRQKEKKRKKPIVRPRVYISESSTDDDDNDM